MNEDLSSTFYSSSLTETTRKVKSGGAGPVAPPAPPRGVSSTRLSEKGPRDQHSVSFPDLAPFLHGKEIWFVSRTAGDVFGRRFHRGLGAPIGRVRANFYRHRRLAATRPHLPAATTAGRPGRLPRNLGSLPGVGRPAPPRWTSDGHRLGRRRPCAERSQPGHFEAYLNTHLYPTVKAGLRQLITRKGFNFPK